jgi:glutathione peroxidase
MNRSLAALSLALAALGTAAVPSSADVPEGTVYGFKERTIEGKSTTLERYRGRILLIVNVASKCGFTPQYEGLEKLYLKYKDRGFVILGFPCNQFKNQEPGTDSQIKSFCTTKYGVTFPLFSKIEVNGPGADPLYRFLKKAQPGDGSSSEIGWNFTKFLINTQGVPIKRYATPVKPEEIEKDLQQALERTHGTADP